MKINMPIATHNHKKPLGLYIHIPFCRKKCNYCDFLSITASESIIEDYITAVKKEIKTSENKFNEYKVSTIFIGGGTPSYVKAEHLEEIIGVIYNTFNVEDNIEITVEVNPGTITKEKMYIYKRMGVNRISMGLQSAHDAELKVLGRIHNFQDFKENFLLLRDMNFNNINVDLMFSIPKQTEETFKMTIENVLNLSPEHISAYSLIVEEGTVFYNMYKENKLILPDEDEDRKMYDIVKRILKDNGYIRYEVSNFSKEGFQCIHNTCCWERTDYLGFGAGAASLINNERYVNTNDIMKYTIDIDNENAAPYKDILSEKEQMEEFMFLGLRMIKGVSKNKFKKVFNKEIEEIYGAAIKKLKKEFLLIESQEYINLTDKGIDLSNYALSEFLL